MKKVELYTRIPFSINKFENFKEAIKLLGRKKALDLLNSAYIIYVHSEMRRKALEK